MPRLRAAAFAVAAIVSLTACSGESEPSSSSTGPALTTTTTSVVAEPTGAVPGSSGGSTTTASTRAATATNTGSTVATETTSAGTNTSPPPPPPFGGSSEAFCATAEQILDKTLEMLGPAVVIDETEAPENEKHQAWLDLKQLADEGKALAQQAWNQAPDAGARDWAAAVKTIFSDVADAAAAKNRPGLDAATAGPAPDIGSSAVTCI